jgi:hypothetical protein
LGVPVESARLGYNPGGSGTFSGTFTVTVSEAFALILQRLELADSHQDAVEDHHAAPTAAIWCNNENVALP